MSRYGEQIPLPLHGTGQYQCPHLGDVYTLENGHLRRNRGTVY
jgi:UDP-2-acetamido-3-amino-2,3-dideoxy-glucuronate N-acetyltransferase